MLLVGSKSYRRMSIVRIEHETRKNVSVSRRSKVHNHKSHWKKKKIPIVTFPKVFENGHHQYFERRLVSVCMLSLEKQRGKGEGRHKWWWWWWTHVLPTNHDQMSSLHFSVTKCAIHVNPLLRFSLFID
jgi:hypothetical protein